MNKKYNYIYYFLVYLSIAILYTWPLVINFRSMVYAQPGDAFATIYNFWKLPFSDISLSFPNQPIFLAIVRLARYFFSEIVTYNLFILSSFLLTAIAGYVLIGKLIKNNFIAFLGGLIFMLAPFRIAQSMQHINFSDLSVVLFFIYFLIKIREEKNWFNGIGVFLFYLLITLINYQYGFIAMIIYLIYLIANFIFVDKKYRYNFLYSILAILGAITIILIFNKNIVYDLLLLSQGQQTNFVTVRSFDELSTYSAKWFYYFLPSPDNPFFKNLTHGFYNQTIESLKTNLTEQTIYLGIINIFFAIIAFINIKKINKFILGFAILLIIFGIYFSFSPTINIFGFNLSTPSVLLYKYLPFFRVYARLGMITYIGITILACYGIYYLIEKINNNFYKKIFKILVVLLIFADLLVLPSDRLTYASYDAMPKSYKKLQQLPVGTVLEYPALPPEEPQSYSYLFWQRVHNMPVFYNHSNDLNENEYIKSVANPNSPEVIQKLKDKEIMYIIIHENLYNQKNAQKYPVEYNNGEIPVPYMDSVYFLGRYGDDLIYKIK